MATKTFEELKQLAIQIRDEKTNKQNTATRIGTQMLEHLNKLEQDYYDKTATDEELKQRDEKLSELSSINEEHRILDQTSSNLFINYVNTTTVGGAIRIEDGAIIKQSNVSDAFLHAYTLNNKEKYYLKSKWESASEGYPLIVFTRSDGITIVDYMYMNRKGEQNSISYTEIEIPEGAEIAYVNSRYVGYGECGLFKKAISTRIPVLNSNLSKAINIFDNSTVKDDICLVIDGVNGCYLSEIKGYSIAIVKVEENTEYVLSNYNCPSKTVAVLDEKFNIVDYKSTDLTISKRISKEGDWKSDSSPINVITKTGDTYIAFNVQQNNDLYYRVVNTEIMLSKKEYTGLFIHNVEVNFAKKLFNHGIRNNVPLDLVYGSYYDSTGNSVANGVSCRCELSVSSGVAFLIHALPASARYIHECDENGDIIASYNDVKPSSDNSKVQDIVIVTSAKTRKLKISTALTDSIKDIKVYSLTPSYTSNTKKISILFIGNSLTQDAVSYVPFLLRNIAPQISFKFYVWYNGGKTLEEQYNEYFMQERPCQIFSSSENSYSWSNKNNSVTIKEILAQYKFDILCLQEYFNYKESYTEADIEVYKNVIKFIEENYNEPFKLVTLFHQPKRDDAESIYNLTLQGVKKIISETPTEDILVPGVAIYKALSTSLNSLGDKGGLSPDGTHSQEGLPCLMQAYTVVMWIFRQLGVAKSILNNKNYITSENYESINVPGPNLGTGVVEGSKEQNRLAQEIAVLSYKESIKIQLVE